MMVTTTPPAGTTQLVAVGSTGAPRVAGNGGVVVWPEARNGHMAIVKYDHGTISQISEDGYDCTNPVVSDDGKVVVYSRFTPAHGKVPGNFDICKNEDGVNTLLTTDPGNQFDTAISGDGKTVAWDDDLGTNFKFFQVDKWNNGAITRLSDAKIDAENPFIASATGQVFFTEAKAGRSRITGEGPDGTVAPVVNTDSFPVFTDVSSDGRLFSWADTSGKMDRVVHFADGTLQPVVAEAGADNTWPRINGDGSQTVWTRIDRTTTDPKKPDITIQATDGSQVYTLASAQGTMVPGMPDVSKDGSTVAWLAVDLASSEPSTQVFVWEKAPTSLAHPSSQPFSSQGK